MFDKPKKGIMEVEPIKWPHSPHYRLGKDVEAIIGLESDSYSGPTMYFADNNPVATVKAYPDNMFEAIGLNTICMKFIFDDDDTSKKIIHMDKKQAKALIKLFKIQLKRMDKYEKRRKKYLEKKSTNNS
jgi:hypothetical protein